MLAYYAPDFALRVCDMAGLMDEDWHSASGYEIRLQGMADGWVMSRDNEPLFWVLIEHRNNLYVLPSHRMVTKGRQRTWTPLTQGLAESGQNALIKSR